MKCSDVERLIDNYLAGMLLASTADELAMHLEECPLCSRLLCVEDPQLDALLASDWYMAAPRASLTERVMQEVTRKSPAWVWWALLWSGYVSLWVLAGSVLMFYKRLPWLAEFIGDMLKVGRTMAQVLGVTLQALQFYRLSTFGLAVMFSALALVVVGMGVLSKEEFAR